MPFKAYIDDSGSDSTSPIFVLAGFAATDTQWTAFAADWQAVLDLPPKIEYLKMSDAARFAGEFARHRGWDEAKRDDRLVALARVIRKHTTVRVSAWIRRGDFEREIKSLPSTVRRLSTDNPYIMLFQQMVLAVATFGDRHGIVEPCEFTFDRQQSFEKEAEQWWPVFKQILASSPRSDIAKFVGDMPSFGDEKVDLPLQAADLYAWQVRRHCLQNRVIIAPSTPVLRVLSQIGAINREFSTEEVKRLRAHLQLVGKRHAELFPSVPLVTASADKRTRQRAHRQARHLSVKP